MDNYSDFTLVSVANNQFSHKFYEIISKQEGNVFFSPLSAHAILALLYQGSAEQTAKAFEDVLEISNYKTAANGYNGLMKFLNQIDNVQLHIANKIYIEEKYPLKCEFKKTATKSFLSDVQEVNFMQNVETAKCINEWVENKTNSKIKNLVSPNDLSSSTQMMLVNAIYFKGGWLFPFRKESTELARFHITNDHQIECQMMHIKKRFDYWHDEYLKSKILKMKYENEKMFMIIILPDEIEGIRELEIKIRNANFATLTQHMRNVEVEVSLPKFKIETTMDLMPILTKMGLGIIFDENKANFSDISDSKEELYIGAAIQKAFIEVNEEGAEAAAATVKKMLLKKRKMVHQNAIFVADHPFMILLQIFDKEEIEFRINTLFYGKIVNPNL